jgi:hypothetical protein
MESRGSAVEVDLARTQEEDSTVMEEEVVTMCLAVTMAPVVEDQDITPVVELEE